MKTLKLAMVAVAVIIASSANAADDTKKRGFFTALDGSHTSLDGFCQDAKALATQENLTVPSCSESELGFHFSGGYRFNEFFAAEAQAIFVDGFHATFRTPSDDDVKVDVDYRSFALGGQGRYPLGDKFSLIGRVGIHAWDADSSVFVNGIDTDFRANDSGTDPYFGVGASLKITDDIRVETGYTRYKADGGNVDVITFGFGVDFGWKIFPWIK